MEFAPRLAEHAAIDDLLDQRMAEREDEGGSALLLHQEPGSLQRREALLQGGSVEPGDLGEMLDRNLPADHRRGLQGGPLRLAELFEPGGDDRLHRRGHDDPVHRPAGV